MAFAFRFRILRQDGLPFVAWGFRFERKFLAKNIHQEMEIYNTNMSSVQVVIRPAWWNISHSEWFESQWIREIRTGATMKSAMIHGCERRTMTPVCIFYHCFTAIKLCKCPWSGSLEKVNENESNPIHSTPLNFGELFTVRSLLSKQRWNGTW